MSYTIQFDLPEGGHFFAGDYKGTLGVAPTLATAIIWNDPETPARILENGYGEEMRKLGRIVKVKDGYTG